MYPEKINFFDSHLHIIDKRYPVFENQGYLPNEFTVSDYSEQTKEFDLSGGAIVSGSFQKFDQSYLLNALHLLGPNFVGVTQIKATTTDEEILNLNASGVRAVRFNLKRGGSEDISRITTLAHRINTLANWHVELYIDSFDLIEHSTMISELPSVSIDYLGLRYKGFDTLLKLVEMGVKVKATGFGRLDFDPCRAIQEIYVVNPDALMFGTDLPSTRAPRPFNHADIDLIINGLDEVGAHKVLYENANQFYLQKNA